MGDAVDALVAQWRRERPDLDVWPMEVIGRISRLSRLLERRLKDVFARYGLEQHEFDVLATLRRAGPPYELTAGGLLKAAMVTSGAITNRIDRLEAKNLVERVRDSDDRRCVRIRLTDRGRELVDEILPVHLANETGLLSVLSPDDRDHLIGVLRTLLESLGDTFSE
ncbi:MarR family winged helix-turn-helix transcriptional regulator [Thermostaphylospora chromogena]|uniref:DNA-binding transcriptional regulator, MarR family n=1 Tax=Thermostaphylospora chromogena TaxID=35622 RepID=A0A1H1BHB6_9ACTN|nr:MarR family transcriptional regulator [Thermostaphylospora chromogena]SDQ51150.1 DNA-binding transcriptional regulator, MarR family [Thermostaphylospora chromogena]